VSVAAARAARRSFTSAAAPCAEPRGAPQEHLELTAELPRSEVRVAREASAVRGASCSHLTRARSTVPGDGCGARGGGARRHAARALPAPPGGACPHAAAPPRPARAEPLVALFACAARAGRHALPLRAGAVAGPVAAGARRAGRLLHSLHACAARTKQNHRPGGAPSRLSCAVRASSCCMHILVRLANAC
jgi:hypothetical protein